MASIPGAAGPGAKFPQWSYNTTSHQVAEVPDAFAKAAAETATWPDRLIFFTSEQAADAYMASQGGGADTSRSPVQAAANAASAAGQAAADAAKGGWHLTFGNVSGLLGRSLKIVLGAILLIGGILKMADVSPARIAAAVPAGMFAL